MVNAVTRGGSNEDDREAIGRAAFPLIPLVPDAPAVDTVGALADHLVRHP